MMYPQINRAMNFEPLTSVLYNGGVDTTKNRGDLFLYSSLGLFVLGLVGISSSSIREIFLLFFLILFLTFSVRSFRAAVIISIVLIPLAGVIKLNGSETNLTILFQSIMFLIVIAATFFHVVILSRFKISKLPLSPFLPFIPFFLIVWWHILVVAIENPTIGAAYFREYIIPFLLFLVYFYALKKKAISVIEIISLLVVATTLVSVLNLAHYFVGISAEYPKYIHTSNFSKQIYERAVFGVSLPRSQHLLGLGSQGGGAVFYAIVGSLSLLLASVLRGPKKTLAIFAAIALFAAGAFVISGSFIITLFAIGLYLNVVNPSFRKRYLQVIKILPWVVVFSYLLLSKTVFQMGSQNQLLSYGQIFVEYGIGLFKSIATEKLLFGVGPELLGAYGNEAKQSLMFNFDTWVFSALPQTGLLGFLSLLISWAYWIFRTVVVSRHNIAPRIQQAVVGIILIGAFGYVHQVAFMSRLMIPLLMIALAITAVNSNSLKKR